MARAESKMLMGYLPIKERRVVALFSLVAPAAPAHRLLDLFAGEGAFLDAAATDIANQSGGLAAQADIPHQES